MRLKTKLRKTIKKCLAYFVGLICGAKNKEIYYTRKALAKTQKYIDYYKRFPNGPVYYDSCTKSIINYSPVWEEKQKIRLRRIAQLERELYSGKNE